MLYSMFKRKAYHPLRNTYHQYKRKQEFKRQLRPNDTFLVGHPKSGNTWLTLMTAILIEKNFDHKVNLNNIGEFIPSLHDKDNQIERYSHFPGPRFFRNEAPLYPDLYPKTVYILRDPRAAYVSYYHHCIHDTGRTDWKIEDFIDEMLANGCIRSLEPYLVRWDLHVAEWLERANRQPVHFVKYEEMKQECIATFRKVVDFLNLQCSEDDIQRAVARGDFNSMRKEELTHGAAPYSGTKGEGGFFVRKGKIDGWKEELSPQLAKKIETQFAHVMQRVEYV